MPTARPHTFEGQPNHRKPGDHLHPYFFRRNPSDLLQEAFEELFRHRLQLPRAEDEAAQSDVEDDEREVVREQRWTLFEHDPDMQALFSGDFDAFCEAMDDPKIMHDRLEQRLRRLRGEHDGDPRPSTSTGDARRAWDDERSSVRTWEEERTERSMGDEEHHCEHDHGHDHEADGKGPSLDDDPIYDRAFRWTCRVERWSRRLTVAQQVRDRDLFRTFINATLVPAKVAFGFSGGLDDDLAGLETSRMGYRQAVTFLRRVLESLANCYGKRIGRSQTVHGLADEGRELLADIESKLAEIESEIRYRGGRSSS